MLWQDHISTSEYEFFDSFFRGLVLVLNKRVWALCMCVYFIQLIYSQRMAMKKREEVYLQPHIRTDVCVQYSVRNLKYLNKFWKIKVNIPGRRMRSAKPRINERESEVLGIANLPPSASVILILSPWRSCERKDWRICNLTKKFHPDVSATRLVLYSESFVEALQSPNQANLVRFLFQKDLSVVMWRKLRQRDHLRVYFRVRQELTEALIIPVPVDFELPCVATLPLSRQGALLSVPVGPGPSHSSQFLSFLQAKKSTGG